jgi:hypothetical protein
MFLSSFPMPASPIFFDIDIYFIFLILFFPIIFSSCCFFFILYAFSYYFTATCFVFINPFTAATFYIPSKLMLCYYITLLRSLVNGSIQFNNVSPPPPFPLTQHNKHYTSSCISTLLISAP